MHRRRAIVTGLLGLGSPRKKPAAIRLNGQRGCVSSLSHAGRPPREGRCWVVLDSGEEAELKQENVRDDPQYTGNPHHWPESVGAGNSFATSNFRREYNDQLAPISDAPGVYAAVKMFLYGFARSRHHGLTSESERACTEAFYEKLRDETARRELGQLLRLRRRRVVLQKLQCICYY